MKLYVLGYRGRDAEQDRFIPDGVEVIYSKEPRWRMAHHGLAEAERLNLEQMSVYVGEHHCDFSVEALPEGGFAIVCLSHSGEPVSVRPQHPWGGCG